MPPYRHRVRTGRRRARIIRRDPLVAVLPKDFRRQPDGTVTLQDLAGTGLVWFPHDQLPLIRARILSAFRQAGRPVDIVLDVNRTLTVASCIAAGCGVSLLPHSIHTFAFKGGRLQHHPRWRRAAAVRTQRDLARAVAPDTRGSLRRAAAVGGRAALTGRAASGVVTDLPPLPGSVRV
ncbi:hypothetical protein DF135_02740 [Burkholderia cepacia]|nr:hypothetical protein DF135_02740 [Burkholderia cepacia]